MVLFPKTNRNLLEDSYTITSRNIKQQGDIAFEAEGYASTITAYNEAIKVL
jgi:hypothetical protein